MKRLFSAANISNYRIIRVQNIPPLFTLLISLLLILSSCFLTFASESDEELILQPQKSLPQQATSQPQTLGAEEQLYDIFGPVEMKRKISWPLITLLTLVVVSLIAAALWFYKNRKKTVPPPIPPWDRALVELAEAKDLRQESTGLKYMDLASQILRSYIESRFSIHTTRQTTREFLHSEELQTHRQLLDFRPELQVCLEQADMAKFAHRAPNDQQLVKMEDAVTGFVMKTRPEQPGSSSGDAENKLSDFAGEMT